MHALDWNRKKRIRDLQQPSLPIIEAAKKLTRARCALAIILRAGERESSPLPLVRQDGWKRDFCCQRGGHEPLIFITKRKLVRDPLHSDFCYPVCSQSQMMISLFTCLEAPYAASVLT
jgi:hypothetical protein